MDDGPGWHHYFGFDQPYENQADAVERIIATAGHGGYLAMEGPCGTGKTMAALSAGATLVRETDRFDRMVVVTPVKQQLQQFVADLRTLNAGIDDPLTGISLVGKADLCPYEREGLFGRDVGVQERCEELRDATADLVRAEGPDSRVDGPAEAVIAGNVPDEDRWWDARLAQDLAKAARPDAAAQDTFGDGQLATAGATAPYRPSQPTAPEELTDRDDPPTYCPFEADWFARDRGSPIDFSVGRNHVVTSEDYLPAAVERGTCPHRVMRVLLQHADVVVGNYNHLFDPVSRPLVAAILDEKTFVVVDEAHRLESRVRDLLSDRVGRATLVRARNDCNVVATRARQSDDHRETVEETLAARSTSLEDVERARAFYDDAIDWLDERVRTFLDAEHEGWRSDPATLPDEDRVVPLRDPETVEPDELTEWAEAEGYAGQTWGRLATVGGAVEEVIDELGIGRQPVALAVGTTMGHWWGDDHATRLRTIELTATDGDPRTEGYRQAYAPGLVLYECMPADSLADVFGELGGGVLMSATLEPLEVFESVTGLADLAADGVLAAEDADELWASLKDQRAGEDETGDESGDDAVGDDEIGDAADDETGDGTAADFDPAEDVDPADVLEDGSGSAVPDDGSDSADAADAESADGSGDGDGAGDGEEAGDGGGKGRPVARATYDLPFPAENRASWIVDCTPFTARNRGPPDSMEPLGTDWNATRDEYAHALRALARSPGNVMVAMPNYREARWAGAYLDEAVDATVLVDESSTNAATDRLKERFFAGEGRVLVTSARGTLTEGVDYDGAKLGTCAVVGVPLVSIGSPHVRAVRRAYGDAFGEGNAFDYALTVPAVRRARQAIGRVIRGADEVGVRALVGGRYAPDARRSVHEYLPPDARREFTRMTPDFLADQIDRFWADHPDAAAREVASSGGR